MARKTPEESARTRAAILAAAIDVFTEKGYSKSTLNDIARKAGFTRGAVYWHFSDKADLLIALADEMEKSTDSLLLCEQPNSAADLQQMICGYLDLFDRDERYRKYYEVLWFHIEWSENMSPVLARFRDDMRQMSDWFESVFTRFQEQGQLQAATTPALAATATRALFEGLTSMKLSDPDKFPQGGDLVELLQHFFSAYIDHQEQSK